MTRYPLIFGEVLFDVYDQATEKIGGAPFNVAWHLQRFGVNPLFISKIGADKRGEKILTRMKKWHMSTRGVSVDPVFPTGVVQVKTHNGDTAFSILADQAYDYIGPIDAGRYKFDECPLLYHGTLAIRNSHSADSLKKLKQNFPGLIFVDINLRPPWWNKPVILESLQDAGWLKCNEQELASLQSVLGTDSADERRLIRKMFKQFKLQGLIISRGKTGASLYTRTGEVISAAPRSMIRIKDTVGAGDALSAVIILGLLKKWDYTSTLRRGIEFASQLCQIRGAVSEQAKFYDPFLSRWNIGRHESKLSKHPDAGR